MKKLYNILFYKLYHFWKAVTDDGWSDWKALLIVEVLNGFILVSIDVLIKVLFKRSFILELSKPLFILFFVFFSLLHYFIFLYHDRWKEYEEEFKNYSVVRNKIINMSVVAFIIVAIGSLIFAFYQMSLIDWSKYR